MVFRQIKLRPMFDVKPEDVALIGSLLEGTRKLQRQFEEPFRNPACCCVFAERYLFPIRKMP